VSIRHCRHSQGEASEWRSTLLHNKHIKASNVFVDQPAWKKGKVIRKPFIQSEQAKRYATNQKSKQKKTWKKKRFGFAGYIQKTCGGFIPNNIELEQRVNVWGGWVDEGKVE
jgi:hypothetical protein